MALTRRSVSTAADCPTIEIIRPLEADVSAALRSPPKGRGDLLGGLNPPRIPRSALCDARCAGPRLATVLRRIAPCGAKRNVQARHRPARSHASQSALRRAKSTWATFPSKVPRRVRCRCWRSASLRCHSAVNRFCRDRRCRSAGRSGWRPAIPNSRHASASRRVLTSRASGKVREQRGQVFREPRAFEHPGARRIAHRGRIHPQDACKFGIDRRGVARLAPRRRNPGCATAPRRSWDDSAAASQPISSSVLVDPNGCSASSQGLIRRAIASAAPALSGRQSICRNWIVTVAEARTRMARIGGKQTMHSRVPGAHLAHHHDGRGDRGLGEFRFGAPDAAQGMPFADRRGQLAHGPWCDPAR